MSPEMGTGHSQDNSKSVELMEEKELSPWLLTRMRNRSAPLSSLSKIDLTIPSIATRIWRRLSSYGSQSFNLPIINTESIARMIKTARLSAVWQRMTDLPLLRRNIQRPPQFRQIADTATYEQSAYNMDLEQAEVLTDEYESIASAIGQENPSIIPDRPQLSEHLRTTHGANEVKGESPGNVAQQRISTGKESPLSRSVVDKGQTYNTDRYLSKESYPYSAPPESAQTTDSTGRLSTDEIAQQPGQTINRYRAADTGESARPVDNLTGISGTQQPGQLQGDNQEKGGPAADEGQRIESSVSPPIGEPEIEYTEPATSEVSEQAVTDEIEPQLDGEQSPIEEIHRTAESLSQSIKDRQDIPPVQTPPVQQRSHYQSEDRSIESVEKKVQLPYVTDKSGIKGAKTVDEKLVPGSKGDYRSQDSSVEGSVPDSRSVESTPDYLPDRILSDADKTVLTDKTDYLIDQGGGGDSVQLSNVPMPGSLLGRNLNLEYLTVRRSLGQSVAEGRIERTVVQESPLLQLMVGKSMIGRDTTAFPDIPDQPGPSVSDIQPVSRVASRKAGKIDMPLRYPENVAVYGRVSPVMAEGIQRSTSPMPGYVKSGEVTPVGMELQPVERSYASSTDNARQSLERLYRSSLNRGGDVYASRDEGARTVEKEAIAYPSSQPVQEIALTPLRGTVEELKPEPALAPVIKHAEVLSRQPVQASIEEAAEVTGETGSQDINALTRRVYSILVRRIRRDRERMYGRS